MEIDKIIKNYLLEGQYNNVTELCHIMKKNDIDKGMGTHNYSTFYECLFSTMRHAPLTFLEVGYKKYGRSLMAWRQYFTNARLVYADVEDKDGSVHIVFDQTSGPDILRLAQEIGKMDVILDDAIHQYNDNLFLLANLFECLQEGGIYLIEDLTTETRDLFLEHKDEILGMLPVRYFHMLEIPYVNNCHDNRLLVLQKRFHNPLTIATAASQNHSNSLLQFLSSLITHNVPFDNLFVYDLGLEPSVIATIRNMFPTQNMQIRTFCFHQYPSYFNIEENAGQYAWKPVIIEEVANHVKNGLLFWCDAGNKVMDNLQPLTEFMKTNCVYTPSSLGVISDWTHPHTLQILDASLLVGKRCRNAAQVCFSLNENTLRLIGDWSSYAQMEDCIAPLGSDRSNHRHDQSILSILYYRFIEKHPKQMTCIKDDYFVLIHQDID